LQLLQDGVIAVLAAVGLTSIVWLLAGALFSPRLYPGRAIALLPVEGMAEDMEQQIRELERSRYERRSFLRIVIVDCGLEEETLQRARILCREDCGVELLAAAELTAEIF